MNSFYQKEKKIIDLKYSIFPYIYIYIYCGGQLIPYVQIALEKAGPNIQSLMYRLHKNGPGPISSPRIR